MKKGFTLIELLAVIVILAIIALIATPITLDIIKDSKEESNKRSIEMYASALKNSILKYQLAGEELKVKSLDVKQESKGREFSNTNLKVEYEGNVVCKTIELYKDGNIYLDECTVNDSTKKYTYGKDQSYDNGQIVYFDVKNGVGCTVNDYHVDNSKTGYNGIYEGETSTKTTSDQNSCLKFYAFNDDGGIKLNLLLDHNTTDKLAWNFGDTTASGPVKAKQQLYEDTKEWKGTLILLDYKYGGLERPYTIEYSKVPEYEGATTPYKARLITANEVAEITGASSLLNWDETLITSNWYYLDGAKTNETVQNWQTSVVNSTNKSDYYWLYDRTYKCDIYGCEVEDSSNYGYWTSSAHVEKSNHAWSIYNLGSLHSDKIYSLGTFYGVRPVIEVLKSNLQ